MSPTTVLLHFLDFSTNEVSELPWLMVLRVFFFSLSGETEKQRCA